MNMDYRSGCVATVGFFDGVHVGHKFLIEELKTLALKRNQRSMIITFIVHPRKVLNADFQPQLLNTPEEKTEQLESTQVDEIIELEFTREMAQLTAYEFLNIILKHNFDVKTLLVGHDHRFGHNRTEGFPEYKKYGEMLGIEVIQAQPYSTTEDKNISSSEIRLSLEQGKIERANRLLGYSYSISGKVIDGFRMGRKIGFPTANLKVHNPDKLIPPLGVYAVRVFWNGNVYKGMMNIGTRPTLSNSYHTSLEVNIFDFYKDIYNQTIKVEFLAKIRDEQKFNGVDELVEQLKKDREMVEGMNLNTNNVNK
jgi:riboflavin kinase / FMN adenylyltransferase